MDALGDRNKDWYIDNREDNVMLRHLVGVAVILAAALPSAAQSPAKRPNIVFILADDLGVNDLRCYGRAEHSTPNLDRLAKQGLRFKTAYSAASICSPTRAAI